RGSLMNRYVNLWNNNYWVDYGEWLAAPRNTKIWEAKEKIIVRQTGDRIIATLIDTNIICRKNLHIIISDELNHKFILGILNSKLTDFYYQQINPERGEALAEVKKNHIEQLPIPKDISDKQQTEIIKLVEQLLQFNKELQAVTLADKKDQLQNRISFTEDKLNQIIYKLYELTDEEINLVEATN
ncbi:MAG: endonuclease, partial [Chitinophagaceae bacterium]|nr:endonuclease [Chitinophagaceae bacterium]